MDSQTELKRKRGGQPGNWNRLVHGDRSKRVRVERMAQRQAEWKEERARFEAWSRPILRRCREQHLRVMAELERERQEREEFPEFWKAAVPEFWK